MSWIAVDRPLDPAEYFFWLADRVSSLNFVVYAEIDGALDPATVRVALDRAQRDQPMLGTRIATTADGARFEPAAGRPIPLAATTADDFRALLERELAARFATDEGPLMRAVTAIQPDGARSLLALTLHHCIADGRSGALLLRGVLGEALTGTPPPPRAFTPEPPLHELFPDPFRWEEHPETAEAVYEQQMAVLERYGPVMRMPWLQGPSAASDPRFVPITLDAVTTERLLRRARSNGATLHGALGAAELLATHRLRGAPDARTLLLSSPVDLRRHLVREVPPEYLGLYISVLASPHRVGVEGEFWGLAREINLDVRQQLARGEAHLFYALQALDQAAPTDAGVAWFGKRLRSYLPNVSLSNIGPVDAVAGGGRVRNIAFALCPMPFQLVFCAVSTYAGALHANLAYDATRLPPGDAARMAQGMRGALVDAAEGAD